jgi:hypothetical protein
MATLNNDGPRLPNAKGRRPLGCVVFRPHGAALAGGVPTALMHAFALIVRGCVDQTNLTNLKKPWLRRGVVSAARGLSPILREDSRPAPNIEVS